MEKRFTLSCARLFCQISRGGIRGGFRRKKKGQTFLRLTVTDVKREVDYNFKKWTGNWRAWLGQSKGRAFMWHRKKGLAGVLRKEDLGV